MDESPTITVQPMRRCPTCEAVNNHSLILKLEGEAETHYCLLCYVNWIRQNVPQLEPIESEGE